MNEIELSCFQIISNVGMARSSYIEAISKAKTGNFELAKKCMEEGEAYFLNGHKGHATLIQKEASGEMVAGSLLLIHAEDQLMSAESFKIIANEMIDNYRRIIALEEKLK
ncbi:PTS lactose/cellobiose transporter subunit IIA [Clostridium sp.]|uniref:PTS lactose/cellobiose transporter subunit IIA n=1 Tax=Clostridium sp. TaxID=1506 RepID=UPI0026188D38|nr:PTS lactose/cellobiose transporter subunit IIA [Clostridium sp.]